MKYDHIKRSDNSSQTRLIHRFIIMAYFIMQVFGVTLEH